MDARPSSHAVLYSVNREHLFWSAVEDLLTAPARLEAELVRLVQRHGGDEMTLAVFGSVARGEATADSDIDLLLLLPDATIGAVSEELVDQLTDLVQRRSGNPAQVVTVTHEQLRTMIASSDPLITSLTADARTLTGPSLAGVIARVPRTAA